MNKVLNKIFLTNLNGTTRLVILLYLFIITLVPQSLLALAEIHIVAILIKHIIITGTTIFLFDIFYRKFKNINSSILIVTTICATIRLIQMILLNKSYYFNIVTSAMFPLLLLYTWNILGKRNTKYVWAIVLGFFVTIFTIYSTSLLHYSTVEELYVSKAIQVFARYFIICTAHTILAVALFYIFKIPKLIKQNSNESE